MVIDIIDGRKRFIRAGRPISDWMQQLLDSDLNRRHRAARYLSKMHSESKEMPPGADYATYIREFDIEVRKVAAAPTFDARDFNRRLVDVMYLSKTEQHRLQKQEQDRSNHLIDRIKAEYETADETRRKTLDKRLMLAACGGCDNRKPESIAKRKHSFVFFLSGTMFGALGEHVLHEPAIIRRMLNDNWFSHYACEALVNAGGKASTFADELIEMLFDDANGENYRLSDAVGKILLGDVERINALLDRLGSENDAEISMTLQLLSKVSKTIAAELPTAIVPLSKLALREDFVGTHAATALGKVAAMRGVYG